MKVHNLNSQPRSNNNLFILICYQLTTDPPNSSRVQPQRGPGHVSQRGDHDFMLLVRPDRGEAAAAVPGSPGARKEDRPLAHQRRLHHVQRGPPGQVLVQEARMRLRKFVRKVYDWLLIFCVFVFDATTFCLVFVVTFLY